MEKIAEPVEAPTSAVEAGRWVDDLAKLRGQITEGEKALKALTAEASGVEGEVIAFARTTGRVTVAGSEYTATLRKKGKVGVPTKTQSRADYDALVKSLKEAGVWERYSQMDYAALKKAMADPKHPDAAVFKKVARLMTSSTSVEVELSSP